MQAGTRSNSSDDRPLFFARGQTTATWGCVGLPSSQRLRKVTPGLQSIYDRIVARAAAFPFDERSQRLRAEFGRRCGACDGGDPSAERREIAAWEDALVRGGLGRDVADALGDEDSRRLGWAFESAVRGVFTFQPIAGHLVAHDLWSGIDLLVVREDTIGRELVVPGSDRGAPPCQARLLASLDGCVVLPGVLFHPADALPLLQQTLSVARQRRLGADSVLDAVLRMEQRWRTLSRVKVGYAYRAEFLPTA